MSEVEYSGMEEKMPKRHDHKGGRINIFEPLNTWELMASPITISCLKQVGFFDFCEKVQQVQNHPELTRLFIINFHDKQVNLDEVKFELSTYSITDATGIPSVGEK